MAKHTVTAFVHWEKPYSNDEPIFKVYPFDMTTTGTVLVGKQEIEVEVPDDFNPIPEQVAFLKKQRDQVSEECAKKLMHIDDQISKLQCIEYAPEVTA